MVAELAKGTWGIAEKMSPAGRIAAWEDEFATLCKREGTLHEMHAALSRALRAKIAIRGPDESAEKGWSYQWIDDCAVQTAALRVGAQILGLIKTSAGVTVNNGPQQTLNVTAVERLAELDSIGVPREDIAAACADLLAATGKGAGATPIADSSADKSGAF